MKSAQLLFLGIASLVACKDDRDQAMSRAAERVNPLLDQLREPARTVLTAMGADESGTGIVIDACVSADGAIDKLRLADVKYDDGVRPPHNDLTMSAAALLDDRHLYCGKDSDEKRRECSRWCVISWTSLVIDVERLRYAAARKGVDIHSIAP